MSRSTPCPARSGHAWLRRVRLLAVLVLFGLSGCARGLEPVQGPGPALPAADAVAACQIHFTRNDQPEVFRVIDAVLEDPDSVATVLRILGAARPWSVATKLTPAGEVQLRLKDGRTIRYNLLHPGALFQAADEPGAPYFAYDALALGSLAGQTLGTAAAAEPPVAPEAPAAQP